MHNFFFATKSGTIYHVGEGTITRVAKNDQSNVPFEIHAAPFTWNVEPEIGKRADYKVNDVSDGSGGGYVTTSEVTHIWPAPVGYSMLPEQDPEVADAAAGHPGQPLTAFALADSLVAMFATA